MKRPLAVAAIVTAALAFGACGESPEDEAREDGERVGEAVRALFDSESLEEARAAAAEVGDAVEAIGEDARDAVREQVTTQSASLVAAAEALQEADTTGVKAAVQEIRAQAEAFQQSDDSVANEFWRGFQDGYDDG
jgi:hypothetical protein